MLKCVAFLRGINLTDRRVRSAQLREVFDELGLLGVSTFLASRASEWEESAGSTVSVIFLREKPPAEVREDFIELAAWITSQSRRLRSIGRHVAPLPTRRSRQACKALSAECRTPFAAATLSDA